MSEKTVHISTHGNRYHESKACASTYKWTRKFVEEIPVTDTDLEPCGICCTKRVLKEPHKP